MIIASCSMIFKYCPQSIRSKRQRLAVQTINHNKITACAPNVKAAAVLIRSGCVAQYFIFSNELKDFPTIGLSAIQFLRSFAKSPADEYRAAGFFLRQILQMAAILFGRSLQTFRACKGGAPRIFSSTSKYVSPRIGNRWVSNSNSITPKE